MSSGTCGCQGYDLTQGDDYKTVMGMLSYVEFYIGGFSEDIQRQVVEIICNGVTNFGEHSQVTGAVVLWNILSVCSDDCWNNEPRLCKIYSWYCRLSNIHSSERFPYEHYELG